jgi:hypothetical protein
MRREWPRINNLAGYPHGQTCCCGNTGPEIRDDKLPNFALRKLRNCARSGWCPQFADGTPPPILLPCLKDCRNEARLHIHHNRTRCVIDDEDTMKQGDFGLLGRPPLTVGRQQGDR